MGRFLSRRKIRLGSYSVLLLALMGFLVIHSALQEAGIQAHWLTRVLFPIILLATMVTASEDRRQLRALIGLFLILLVLDVLEATVGGRALRVLSLLGHQSFLLWTLVVILVHVFRQRVVTPDAIVGSVCAYLLLGMFFNEAFTLVELLVPGSFEGLADVRTDGGYFSLVTLSTLGYGDVVPVKAVARSISAFAAVAGQFYIAVIVARLVASYVANRHSEAEAEDAS